MGGIEKENEFEPMENTTGGCESCMTWLLLIFSWLLILCTLPFSLLWCVKTVQVISSSQ